MSDQPRAFRQPLTELEGSRPLAANECMVVLLCAGAAAGVAVGSLLGQATATEWLQAEDGQPWLTPLTAGAGIALSLALAAQRIEVNGKPAIRRLRLGVLSALAGLGLFFILASLAGMAIAQPMPSRPAALGMLLFTVSLLTAETRFGQRPGGQAATRGTVLLVTGISGVAVFGKLAGVPLFMRDGLPLGSLATPVLLFFLGLSVAARLGLPSLLWALLSGSGNSLTGRGQVTKPATSRRVILTLAAFVLLLGAAAYGYSLVHLREHRRRIAAMLSSVADLRVAQLVDWRRERMNDGRTLIRAPLLAQAVDALSTGVAVPRARQLTEYFEDYRQTYGYRSLVLVDANRQPVFSLPANAGEMAPAPPELRKARDVIVRDLFLTPLGEILLDVFVPLLNPETDEFVGALVLRADARAQLLPLLRSWPVPSDSAETLLLRREGERVVALSETRENPEAALRTARSIHEPKLLGAKAVRQGRLELTEGIDYRGRPVLGVARRVADSQWVLVAKIDQAEAYAPVRTEIWRVSGAFGLLLLGVGVGLRQFWRNQHLIFQRQQRQAEDERRAALARLGLVLKHANDIILLFDEQMRLVEANERAQSAYGYTADELLKLTVSDFRAQETIRELPGPFAAALAGGTVFESRHRRKDGTTFPVEVSTRRLVLDDRPLVLSIIRDISERVALARKRQEVEQRLHYLVSSSPIVIYSLAGDGSFRTTFLSENVRKLLGYEPGEFLASPGFWRERLHPDDVAATLAAAETLAHQEWIAREYRFRHQDGTYRWMRDEMRAVRDAAGVVQEYVGSWLDITARKEAEETLRESEERYRIIAENTKDVIWMCDLRTRCFTFISPSVYPLHGFRPEEIIGRPMLEMTHPEERERIEQLLQERIRRVAAGDESARSATNELRQFRKDGSSFLIEVVTTLVGPAGTMPTVMLGITRDITARKQAELAMRKLSRAVEQAPLSIAITDLSGAIEYVNPKFTEVTGYTLAEALGKNPRVLKSGLTPQTVFTEMWQTLAAGHVWRGELVNRRKDGELYSEMAVIAPVVDENGAATHYVALKEDITARKRTEAELARTQERYRLIAENTRDVIWLYELADRTFSYVSPSVEQHLGYTAGEFRRHTLESLLTPAYADRIARWLPRRIAALQRGVESARTLTMEVDHLARDGRVVPSESVTTLLTDDRGKVVRILGVSRDIAERRQAKLDLERTVVERTAELAARNREVQALLQANPDMVLRLEAAGQLLYFQPARAGSRLAALSNAAGTGQAAAGPPPLLDASLTLAREALRRNATATTEVGLTLAAGGPITVELRAAPAGQQDAVVFVRDITDRKQIEAEMAATIERERAVSEMKSRFIAVTSHEFRTPMAAAMGSVDLLANHLDRLSPAKRQELFGRITHSLRRVTEMLDDVLTLNRLEGNRVPVQFGSFSLAEFLANVVEEIRVGDRDAHRFRLLVPTEPVSLVSDAQLLHHILSNLLSNAVRYSSPGTLIGIEAHHDERNVRITVSDEGIGVPEADLGRIFLPFERGSNVANIKGTGLGLNIVKRMTELLDGRVSVESALGRGTTFHLDFPRQPRLAHPDNAALPATTVAEEILP